jgi:preprotein translocase subunit SecA
MMETLKIDDDMPIDQKILSGAIEQAQKKVESRNFQSRKNVLEYDDVMNLQREKIYEQRRMVLDGENIKQYVVGMINGVIETAVNSGFTGQHSDNTEITKPYEGLFLTKDDCAAALHMQKQELLDFMNERASAVYEAKEAELGLMENTDVPLMRELERVIMLRVVDEYWMDHIDAMQELRQGVGLRAYGQVNPIDEYKHEGFEMFEAMVNGIREEVVRRIFVARVRKQQAVERKSVSRTITTAGQVGGDDSVTKQPVRAGKKIGRNDPCPCGKLRPNGLPMKYKDCCGKYE